MESVNMQNKGSLKIAGIVFFVILVGTGFYFAARRTLIADFRESLVSASSMDTYSYGETLFQTRGCAGCHQHDPAGSMGDEGPNLTDIAARHDADFVRSSIVTPNAVIAPRCPEGPCSAGIMPDYGSILNAEQVDALVVYLMASPG